FDGPVKALHLLVRPSWGLLPLPLLLRRGSITGATLPGRYFSARQPDRPALQRHCESADAIPDSPPRCDGLPLLPIREATDVFQSAELPARGRGRLCLEAERASDPVR